jgi:cyclophilin family peptidyl-prolyl cis-trans isomerase
MLGLVLAGWLTGCGGKEETSPPAQAPKLTVQAPATTHATPPVTPQVTPEARLHQAFKEATLQEPPPDQWLPEVTKTGKSIGKLYEAVVAEWGKVAFVTPEGKQLAYSATITTDLGDIKIEFWPQVAPNHVRNFVALARVGYYDGLEFDRAVKREVEDKKDHWFKYLEAGCPLGSGDIYYGSIGYWLKPEFNTDVKHDEGTVGAWHAEEVETAASKFYINLSRAEWMDGNFTLFGKITEGLDVAHAIHGRRVRDDEAGDRPIEPVVIRRVAIECREKQ